MYAQVTLHLES